MMDKNISGASRASSAIVESAYRAPRVVQPVKDDNTVAKLVNFQVTTDSVVATARLIFDDSHRRISLHWGDDTIDEINLEMLRQKSRKPGDQQDPNTLELQHVYAAPHDYGRKIVIAKTRDLEGKNSWDYAVIDIARRYVFKSYPITIKLPEHLDSYFEAHSEVEVRLMVYQNQDLIKSGVWVDDIVTKPHIGPLPGESESVPSWRLESSAFTKEISHSDSPIYIHIDILEHDGPGKYGEYINIIWDFITTPFQWSWWVAENIPFEFDTSGLVNPVSLPLEVHPASVSSISDSYNGRYNSRFKIPYEGEIIVSFDLEMKLVVPVNQDFRPAMTRT